MSKILHQHVVVISDIHVGDPKSLNLDEFQSDALFENFLSHIIPTQVGRPVTLVINGDFIDFPQAKPELSYHSLGPQFGAAEVQSLERFIAVRNGHPGVFSALRKFIEKENQVIILAGNHDIDLHWPSVYREFLEVLGGPQSPQLIFCDNGYLCESRIYIEHGNQYSMENQFASWERPILASPDGPRIERPWGTFFMDSVYNDIEAAFPVFNKGTPIKDITKLHPNLGLFRRSYTKIFPHYFRLIIFLRCFARKPRQFMRLTAELMAFMISHGKLFSLHQLLGDEVNQNSIGRLVATLLPDWPTQDQDELCRQISQICPIAPASPDDVTTHPNLLGRTIDAGLKTRAINIIQANEADIVVFGHTHEAVDGNLMPLLGKNHPARVFNTGSWIPGFVVENPFAVQGIDDLSSLTLREDVHYLVINVGTPITAQLRKLDKTTP